MAVGCVGGCQNVNPIAVDKFVGFDSWDERMNFLLRG